MSWPLSLGRLKVKVTLPPNYHLEEDEDFIYLKKKGEIVAVFFQTILGGNLAQGIKQAMEKEETKIRNK